MIWCARTGRNGWATPKHLISGVPDHVDGLMLGIAERAGAHLINGDRMWHYVEGVHNWDPIWTKHAIRILPGPSSLWFDATGRPAAGAMHARFRYAVDARPHHEDRLRLFLVRAEPDRSSRRSSRFPARNRTPISPAKSWRQVLKRAPAAAFPPRCRLSSTMARISSSRRICRLLCRRMNALTGDNLIDEAQVAGADRGA